MQHLFKYSEPGALAAQRILLIRALPIKAIPVHLSSVFTTASTEL